MRNNQNLNAWKLIHVRERNWQQDTSGLYTVIHYTVEKEIRVDLMNSLNMPCVSIQGETIGAVYKGLADYLESLKIELSAEHLLYIGTELQKAAIQKSGYIQDV